MGWCRQQQLHRVQTRQRLNQREAEGGEGWLVFTSSRSLSHLMYALCKSGGKVRPFPVKRRHDGVNQHQNQRVPPTCFQFTFKIEVYGGQRRNYLRQHCINLVAIFHFCWCVTFHAFNKCTHLNVMEHTELLGGFCAREHVAFEQKFDRFGVNRHALTP